MTYGLDESSSIRLVLRAIFLEVRQKLPELQWKAVNSLLFLRFLTPSITNPVDVQGPFPPSVVAPCVFLTVEFRSAITRGSVEDSSSRVQDDHQSC